MLPLDLEDHLTRQRSLLRRMGPVNPEAKQEYDAVKQRCDFMKAQLTDLNKAEADLHHVIAELDELTKTEFMRTFASVAEEFHDIFHRLFGGGSTRLVLTDPENLTETGIDIEARLPGRREQGLSLLSGGERSLTANVRSGGRGGVACTAYVVTRDADRQRVFEAAEAFVQRVSRSATGQ